MRLKKEKLTASLQKTARMFVAVLPVIVAVVFLSGLLIKLLPAESAARLFGRSDFLDAFIGAAVGSVVAGHPLTSYVLGGELLSDGVSLVAVTALLVSWVTVGSVQLPAEALMLGRHFAIYRNLLCFGLSVLIAMLTVATLHLAG